MPKEQEQPEAQKGEHVLSEEKTPPVSESTEKIEPRREHEEKYEKPPQEKPRGKILRYLKDGSAIGKELIKNKQTRAQIANGLYTTATSIAGVKFIGDLARIPLGKRYGKEAGGDIYKKTVEIKSRHELGESMSALMQDVENIRKTHVESKQKPTSEMREVVAQNARKVREHLNELLANGRISREEALSMRRKVHDLVKEHGTATGTQDKKRQQHVQEAVNTFVTDKVTGMRIARDGWNTALTLSGIGLVAPFARSGGYIGFELAERLKTSAQREKKEKMRGEADEKITKRRAEVFKRLEQEGKTETQERLKKHGIFAGEQHDTKVEAQQGWEQSVKNVVVNTAQQYWQDLRALALQGRTKEQKQIEGIRGKITRVMEAGKSAGSLLRACSLVGQSFYLHHTERTDDIPRAISEQLQKIVSTRGKSLVDNFSHNIDTTVDAYKQALTPHTYIEAGKKVGAVAQKIGAAFNQPLAPEQQLAEIALFGEAHAATLPQPPLLQERPVRYTTYMTAKGDSLWKIARPIAKETGTSVPDIISRIKKESHLAGDIILPNQKLKLPVAEDLITRQEAHAAALPQGERSSSKGANYVVKEGDSLWKIATERAKETKMSVPEFIAQIKKENNLTSDTILPNQKLKIPVVEDLIEHAKIAQETAAQQLNTIIEQSVGTPYSKNNNCMWFLKNSLDKAGLRFPGETFTYAGTMIDTVGEKVSGINIGNIEKLKAHPGEYLIAFGHRYQRAKNAPVMDTWNHAGHVKVYEDGRMVLTHSSSTALKTKEGGYFSYSEYRSQGNDFYDHSGRKISGVVYNREPEQNGTGWVVETSLEEYLEKTPWSQIEMTRIDGKDIALPSEPQTPLDENALSPRQKATIAALREKPIPVLQSKKGRREFLCSKDVIERLRLIHRGLPRALNLSVGDSAPVDAPQVERTLASKGGTVAASMKKYLSISSEGQFVFHEKFGAESTRYKNEAKMWIREAAKGPFGLITFLHEGTSIARQIRENLPYGGGMNSHLVLTLGAMNERGAAQNKETLAQFIQNAYHISSDAFQKSSWAFEALGITVNGVEVTATNANWANQMLNSGDIVEIRDVAMNDNVGGTIRSAGVVKSFFVKDHTFHPVSVLRPNTQIVEETMKSLELPIAVSHVHHIQENETLGDIFRAYKIPQKQWGDVTAYLYAQGFDAKHLRAGSVIALPELDELQKNRGLVLQTAEKRLDQQVWERKERYERNIVVASNDTAQSVASRVFPEKLLPQEEREWLAEELKKREELYDNPKQKVLTKQGATGHLEAGDVVRVGAQERAHLWQRIEEWRKEDRIDVPEKIPFFKKNALTFISLTKKERNLINRFAQNHPEFSHRMSRYLTAILTKEQKGGGTRKVLKGIGSHLGWMKKIPILGKHVPAVDSLGTFQIRATSEIAETITNQYDVGKEITLMGIAPFKKELRKNENLNILTAAVSLQKNIDALRYDLRLFGEQARPGEPSFDFAVINSYNRGLSQTVFGVLEMRMKDLAYQLGVGGVWGQKFGARAITGNPKERALFRDVFVAVIQALQARGQLALPQEQLQNDLALIKSNLGEFLGSPTMQAVKKIYPSYMGQKNCSLLAHPEEINRKDFKAWNYVSSVAQSNLLPYLEKRKGKESNRKG